MRKRCFITGLAFTFVSLFCFAAASCAFECDGKFIKIGSYRDEVLQRCGPPISSDKWQEERFVDGYIRDNWRPGGYVGARTVLVTFDRWTYNLGPNRFMQILTFQDAKLIRIESGSTGY